MACEKQDLQTLQKVETESSDYSCMDDEDDNDYGLGSMRIVQEWTNTYTWNADLFNSEDEENSNVMISMLEPPENSMEANNLVTTTKYIDLYLRQKQFQAFETGEKLSQYMMKFEQRLGSNQAFNHRPGLKPNDLISVPVPSFYYDYKQDLLCL
ncbi:hypothetical protein H920_09322 [Fukomys damarensis]|uniref:Uncharacterized protein n=1 Tax=Fukomys damarensis TaxID=885580 RepID=A0A091DAY8_FUKDA|nr:hypothetical protein H920_09322 [Fukomys damarensis]